MRTLKQFCEQSHINAALIRAVVKQSGGWSEFKERANDITNHGVDAGVSGWIYYSETVPFWRKNRKLIIELANSVANDVSEQALYTVQHFNCLCNHGEPIYSADEIGQALYRHHTDEFTSVHNALAWFALEEVARSYVDLVGG